jgi:hypothetical protein
MERLCSTDGRRQENNIDTVFRDVDGVRLIEPALNGTPWHAFVGEYMNIGDF